MHAITQSCVLLLWMHTLTFVKSQDCSLQQFLNSNLYNSNFDTTNLEANYADKKSVRVGCNVGYSGFFKLICNKGKWTHRGTPCQPRSCGHPGDAQFADFNLDEGEDFVFGSRVVYTCHKGYQMVSRTNHRRCMAEGWDGVVPVCEAQQCAVIRVADNVQVNGDLEEATFGNVVRFSCKSNYQILKGSVEIYCEESGEWSGLAPECKDPTCDRPVIAHGSVIGDNLVYREHEILHFQCNHRYKRTEFRPSTCTKVGIRAEFSPTPVCEPIRCKLEQSPGTWFENEQRNLVSPGETVTVNCGEKYWIANQQTTSIVITCQDNGQWTVTPVCKEVICNRQDQLVHRWYDTWRQIKLGDTVNYQCKRGYRKTNGNIPATCIRNGWHPNPLCEEIICQRKELQNAIIVNDNRQEYRLDERINYVCNEGYRGRPFRTCRESSWAGNSQCQAITCDRQDIQNADIDHNNDKQKYAYNERVHYVCKKGYEGNVFRTCTRDGWTENSQCTGITCQRREVANANIVNDYRQEYRYNEQVNYACNEGYEGRVTRTCTENGLTGDSQCKKTCQKPQLQHGFFVGPYNDTLYYTCNEGYKRLTKAWWGEARCGDGDLSGQCIKESTCGEVPMIPNGRVIRNDDGSIKISCDKGYQVPNDNLICHEGSWTAGGSSPEIICARISGCSYPEKVANAVITTPYQRDYLHGSTVTYKCRKEYKMEGENTLQCINGTWEEKNIICTKITCPRQEVANANIVNDDRQEYAYNEQVNYVCKEGYEGHVTRTCTENGLTGDSQCTSSIVRNGDAVLVEEQ